MPDMLLECWMPCVISVGGGGLVVIGAGGYGYTAVQVFDGKTQTWHIRPLLPVSCAAMTAVVYGDLVVVVGGSITARGKVWCANINDLVSHWV